jgi:hypothetical protein
MARSSQNRWSLPGLSPKLSPGPAGSEDPIADSEQVRTDLTLAEATELLDWLEGHGIQAESVELTPAGSVTVRWRG